MIRYLADASAAGIAGLTKAAAWLREDLQPNLVLQKMYRTGKVEDASGKSHKYNSGISPVEGYFLYKLVTDNKDISDILEIGCAFGTSALYMCQGLQDKSAPPDAKVLSIDPYQRTQWKSIGLKNVSRAGLHDRHLWLECTSDIALAKLYADDRKFDLIFIDGMHLFDFTIVDAYFSAKLLRIGGVLVIDDIRHPGVAAAFSFLKTNYKHFKYIPKTITNSMGMFIKEAEDTREWDFHVKFAEGGRGKKK